MKEVKSHNVFTFETWHQGERQLVVGEPERDLINGKRSPSECGEGRSENVTSSALKACSRQMFETWPGKRKGKCARKLVLF